MILKKFVIAVVFVCFCTNVHAESKHAKMFLSLGEPQWKAFFIFGYMQSGIEMSRMVTKRGYEGDKLAEELKNSAQDYKTMMETIGMGRMMMFIQSVEYFCRQPENTDVVFYALLRAGYMKTVGVDNGEIEDFLVLYRDADQLEFDRLGPFDAQATVFMKDYLRYLNEIRKNFGTQALDNLRAANKNSLSELKDTLNGHAVSFKVAEGYIQPFLLSNDLQIRTIAGSIGAYTSGLIKKMEGIIEAIDKDDTHEAERAVAKLDEDTSAYVEQLKFFAVKIQEAVTNFKINPETGEWEFSSCKLNNDQLEKLSSEIDRYFGKELREVEKRGYEEVLGSPDNYRDILGPGIMPVIMWKVYINRVLNRGHMDEATVRGFVDSYVMMKQKMGLTKSGVFLRLYEEQLREDRWNEEIIRKVVEKIKETEL